MSTSRFYKMGTSRTHIMGTSTGETGLVRAKRVVWGLEEVATGRGQGAKE